MILQAGAIDWLVTLPLGKGATYNHVVASFKENCFRSPELNWKQAEEVWHQVLGVNERIDDFVTSLTDAARRLNFRRKYNIAP